MSNDDLQPPGEQPDSLSQTTAGADAETAPDSNKASSDDLINVILNRAIAVITNPVGFYKSMPKSGGFTDPLVFMIAMAVVAGVLTAALSVFGIGVRGATMGAFATIVLMPIIVAIVGFIGAGIVYVIWKLMGSQENYETAYRCVAYSMAIAPVITILGIFPTIGSIANAVWAMALMAIASIHVHGRPEKLSWSVFGALALFLMVINIGSERAANEMSRDMEELQRQLEEQLQPPN